VSLANPLHLLRAAALGALVLATLLTPGFYAKASVLSMLTTLSFIGCVAVGATFITLSGNIMSFGLGATLGATSMVFVACLPLGVTVAVGASLLFSTAVTALQGWLIGQFRANPIIVSMAALALINGLATLFTAGRGVYPEGTAHEWLKQVVGGVPLPVWCFFGCVAVGQALLRFTRFGQTLYMVGSNRRAALAAGVDAPQAVTGAYALAGLFTAFSAILMAARYGSGEMEFGSGIDYSAISAVLVGGTAIQGGRGSVLRTLAGALVIAVVEALLLLNGFSTQAQVLATGLIVLFVILLQSPPKGTGH
jgi:ribose/xylose/arabinose/galactoside ABC-type transport system permease subunit